MSESKGWIKLHRQIQDSALWDDGTPFDKAHAWIDLLLCVNHSDRKRIIGGEIIGVRQGEMFMSDQFLANRWHWSRDKVRRFLSTIEQDNMITLKRTTVGTWLNVVNYSKFQGSRTTNNTTNNTTVDTTDNTTSNTTDSHNTRMYNSENVSELDNDFFSAAAQKKVPPEKDAVEAYCRERGYKIDIGEFMTYYTMRDWTLGNGRKVTDWQAAVDYWNSHAKKTQAASGQNLASYELYKPKEIKGVEVPYEGGAVAELKRRRKEKA